MSATSNHLSRRMLEWFDSSIHNVAWQQTKFLKWFAGAPGTKLAQDGRSVQGPMIQTVPEGLTEVTTTKYEKMAPGVVATSPQEASTQIINLTQSTDPLISFVTKIAIPFNKVDAWTSQKVVKVKDMPKQVIQQAMFPLTNQIDEYMAYGGDYKTPLTIDRNAGATLGATFTGLFNQSNTFSAGLGNDDNVGQKGDLISTYIRGRSQLRQNGFDKGPYYLLSDARTQENFEQGNHVYTVGTKAITAYSSFMAEYKFKQGDLVDWIQSENAFPGSSSSQNRMVITQPFLSQQGKAIEPAYTLYIGYDFKVLPLFGGGLNGNAEYEWLIYWNGRLHFFDAKSIYRTGATKATLGLTT